MGCCQLRSAAPDTATTARAADTPAPVIASVALPESSPSVAVAIGTPPAAMGRAGPVFLLTRTLRL